MKVFIAAMLVAVTLGEAYSQDRGRRGNRGDRGNRVERNRGGGSSTANRADRGSRRGDRASRPSRTRVDRGSTRADRIGRRADRAATRNDRITRNRGNRVTNPGRINRPGRVDRRINRRVNRQTRRDARRIRRFHNRPLRRYYNSRNYHRPHRYVYRPYRSYRHVPFSRRYTSHRRFHSRYDYYNYLRRNYRSHIYLNWVLFPSSRVNGYYFVDNYPYFIHNGYRHRYSYEDICNYQLVDKYNHQVVRSNYPSTCSRGYDSCAIDRDSYNSSVRENRYFCAETIHGDNYNYSQPTYDYDEYEYDYDYGQNVYNGTNNGRTTCYDYDPQTGICYDN